jgi:hypothetical protein
MVPQVIHIHHTCDIAQAIADLFVAQYLEQKLVRDSTVLTRRPISAELYLR